MAKIRTKTVQIAIEMHNALTALVAAKAMEGNGRVTLRDVVEEAIVQAYPQLKTSGADETVVGAATTSAPAVEVSAPPIDASAKKVLPADLFNRILQATFTVPGDGATPIRGVVLGPSGKPIRLRDLVTHLRDKMPAVSSLSELLEHFEESKAGSVRPS